MAEKANPHSIQELAKAFSYDPATGVVKAKLDRGKMRAGCPVGSPHNMGYLKVNYAGQSYLLHRLIWAISFGRWPNGVLDHKDGDKKNNKLNNLREATASQNARNVKKHVDNQSGYKGVRLDKRTGKYLARIWLRKEKHLGVFEDPIAASAAYQKAADEHFGEFNRGEK